MDQGEDSGNEEGTLSPRSAKRRALNRQKRLKKRENRRKDARDSSVPGLASILSNTENASKLETIQEDSVPEEFAEVLKKFDARGTTENVAEVDEKVDNDVEMANVDGNENDRAADQVLESGLEHLSNRQRKIHLRDQIAELKASTDHPEVVDIWDVTAPDPDLLVQLKSHRNTVPVPVHWSSKRKYLAGKRGTEGTTYKLPDYIEATGIRKVREAMAAQEEKKSLLQKSRDRLRPSVGRMNIDYSLLLQAFEQQSKPTLSKFGDLYYEGKEHVLQTTAMSHLKPGKISAKLRRALGIESDLVPVPWLWTMQKLGPPPSYASVKIPGVTAPAPPGVQWGHGTNGWGMPPAGYEWITRKRPAEEVAKTWLWGTMEKTKVDTNDLEGFEFIPIEETLETESVLRPEGAPERDRGADETLSRDTLVPERVVLSK